MYLKFFPKVYFLNKMILKCLYIKCISIKFLLSFMYSKYSAGQRSWSSNIPPRRETQMMPTSTRSAKNHRMINATCNWSILILQGLVPSKSEDNVMIWFDALSISFVMPISSLLCAAVKLVPLSDTWEFIGSKELSNEILSTTSLQEYWLMLNSK